MSDDVRRQLVLGGQRSGKSRHAQALALDWCRRSATHRASLVATAQIHDDEMRARVERHRRERPPELATAEVPRNLARFVARHGNPQHLLVVDCLTLWLAQWLMPMDGAPDLEAWARERDALLAAVESSAGPLVLVSNEIGLGVMPLGAETRAAVDELGRLHQALAQRCERVTLMVAGLPLVIK
ncbi:MAG: bifunctional adenosylcobinamide kinase/adenosylcobinamide-phosphate guanylyltransferase [Burkholderiales bacterium]|nr:bifunctional adenosylcobinamide kinase/adenosylcobinamide-phosphate guanylyltransferase [Burkholderiales bacterium]MDE2396215.1 bifunctional adenosylcobinamide kinase/adenosylcobinamide-phosphate guanylyltransferase [Burkholderiales bacterium]MDE2453892.1 bifunctional adenosylcobinamide kinase/adenosylcobinamide-phosphate guanylyltransferase [Burkholderiales bacterium]